eukprot:scaffold76273_cov14-Tisochrysis_lutea.AAC.1
MSLEKGNGKIVPATEAACIRRGSLVCKQARFSPPRAQIYRLLSSSTETSSRKVPSHAWRVFTTFQAIHRIPSHADIPRIPSHSPHSKPCGYSPHSKPCMPGIHRIQACAHVYKPSNPVSMLFKPSELMVYHQRCMPAKSGSHNNSNRAREVGMPNSKLAPQVREQDTGNASCPGAAQVPGRQTHGNTTQHFSIGLNKATMIPGKLEAGMDGVKCKTYLACLRSLGAALVLTRQLQQLSLGAHQDTGVAWILLQSFLPPLPVTALGPPMSLISATAA